MSEQITLGELTTLLVDRPKDQRVQFNFGRFGPGGLISYRGYYDQLAVTFVEGKEPSVEEFLATLKAASGSTFEGYKGGWFLMDDRTPLWVAAYGESGGTTIIGIADSDYSTVILTGWKD